jgi:GNAT superfamily N-acetyltransferase
LPVSLERVDAARVSEQSADPEWSDRAERAEAECFRRMIEDLPAEASDLIGGSVARVADGWHTRVAHDPMGGYWNKALGFCDPISDETVAQVVEGSRAAGVPVMAFALQPRVLPTDWSEIAERHGLSQGNVMVKFLGPAEPPADAETDLRIERVGAEHAETFAHVMAAGFGAPWTPGTQAMFGMPAGFDGDWTTYAAFDGDTVVGVARLLAIPDLDTAYLFGAATLAEARGRGAQTALMAARLAEARDRGLTWAGADTWAEALPDHPNPSQHNMLRIGLTEVHRRPNWVWKG